MKVVEHNVAGVRVRAALEPAEVTTLGVRVQFDLGVATTPQLQTMFLETILLKWKAEIGAVTRGAEPQRCFSPGGSWWLPGWTVAVFQEGTVLAMNVVPKGEL